MTSPNRGGYQPPANPSPVPMPGKLSRRTDGGPADKQGRLQLPDAHYGEQATFQADQAGAPMAASAGADAAQPLVMPADLSNVVDLGADSADPAQPITAGASLGDGPGMEALGLDADSDPSVANLRRLLPGLELMANSPAAGPVFRQFVRRVRGSL